VGEHPPGEQRVVGDINAGYEVPDVKGELLRLGEAVRRIGVQGQHPNRLHRRRLR
jgi:hypothetical protein